MAERFAGFDWDRGNLAKCRKHGVSVAEIEALFSGTPAVRLDEAHSGAEARHLAIGRTLGRRWVFVAFAYRRRGGRVYIRPISARYMHAREVRRYEEEDPKL
jgi:uncharacterized DUF497 family protein